VLLLLFWLSEIFEYQDCRRKVSLKRCIGGWRLQYRSKVVVASTLWTEHSLAYQFSRNVVQERRNEIRRCFCISPLKVDLHLYSLAIRALSLCGYILLLCFFFPCDLNCVAEESTQALFLSARFF
jgi:hypothetical protein